MLDKLAAVANRFEELCARSEQPDFYNDPKQSCGSATIWNRSLKPTMPTGMQSRRWQMQRN